MDYRLLVALKSIRQKQLRSWLTILGIVVGAAAIVSLITLSQGLENSVEAAFSSFGTTRIFVLPKGFQATSGTPVEGLTSKDVKALESMSEFRFVTPYLAFPATVELARQKRTINIFGFPTDNQKERFDGYDIRLAKGRFMSDNARFETTASSRASRYAFRKEINPRDKVIINGEDFTVVGVLEPAENNEEDMVLYIPIDTARKLIGNNNGVSFIDVLVKPGIDVNQAAESAKKQLKKSRGNENFEVLTPEQIVSQINTALGIIRIILVGIASISLLVGSVGIANSMYTSVLEQTKNIGIMKSIGARRKDIFAIFLIESLIIGLLGGVIGTVLGTVLSEVVGKAAASAGFPLLVKINPAVILFGILFAVFAGAAAGVLPALSASKLNPVEALRK